MKVNIRIIILLTLFVILLGILCYFYRNNLIKIPIVRTFFSTVGVVYFSDSNNLEIQNNIIKNSTPTSATTSNNNSDNIIDCGVSTPDKLPLLTSVVFYNKKFKDYDKDLAISCMGKALLNDCQKAKIIIKGEDGTNHTEKIIGKTGNNKSCILEFNFGTIKSELKYLKPYQNTSMKCESDRSTFAGCDVSTSIEKEFCDTLGIKNSPAHIYIRARENLLFNTIIGFQLNDFCSGSMVEILKSIENNPFKAFNTDFISE